MATPDRLVFDAEPLVAHASSEPGADEVDRHLDAVAAGDTAGWTSVVTRTEVRYTLARKYDMDIADYYLDRLDELGVQHAQVDEPVWTGAAEFVLQHNPALGDAFALATAETLGATLLVGGDDDYDDVTRVPTVRFRDGSA